MTHDLFALYFASFAVIVSCASLLYSTWCERGAYYFAGFSVTLATLSLLYSIWVSW